MINEHCRTVYLPPGCSLDDLLKAATVGGLAVALLATLTPEVLLERLDGTRDEDEMIPRRELARRHAVLLALFQKAKR